MKRDIENRADIEKLVNAFYKKVVKDELIGDFFTKTVVLDWEEHIPLMIDFWETTLFYKTSYKGNPIKVHLEVNEKSRIKKRHFDRWLNLFSSTIDEHFEGNMAELTKTRATSIATVLQIKLAKT